MSVNTHPNYSNWRAWTLFGVWVFFALHMIHWRFNETTLAPLELNEVLYTIHQGIVTAGFILMVVIMIATLIFGRFFCSWGCHILSLQDASSWILKKLKIRSRPIRSRALIWVPMGAMLYLFVWPQVKMMIYGVEKQVIHVVENTNGQWSSFVTNDFWRNLPPVEIALSTFFIVGFLLIYMMGSRSFCWYGCPYGALFGIADQVAPGRIKLTGDCVQCGTCTVNCTSDILVHQEIKEFGMVTNSRCMKDLDCVSSCPENALSFGFTTPPLFQSKYKLPKYNDRYSFTIAEDILMSIVFILSVLIFRGLYGIIPFLMSVGMSVATAYRSVLLLRLFTKSSASINDMRLKLSGKVRGPGFAFAVVAIVVFGLSVHSAVVQYHTQLGQHQFEQLGQRTQESELVDIELAEASISHLESALAVGFIQPVFVTTELASLYNLLGDSEMSQKLLSGILAEQPENLKVHYRMAILASKSGDKTKSKGHFEKIIDINPEDGEEYFMKSAAFVNLGSLALANHDQALAQTNFLSATEAYNQNSDAWLKLGMTYFQTGKNMEAIYSLKKVLELDSESAAAHHNLGAIYSQTGDLKSAASHFESLVKLQPESHKAHYNLGMTKLQSGDYNSARESLDEAVNINPKYDKARQGLEKLESLSRKKNL